MSKTKERTLKEGKTEKKRKRQEEGDDAPKKSKKSRKSEAEQDVAAPDEPVVEEAPVDKKAAKLERKRLKRERKEKAAESSEPNAEVEAADFIPLDNDDAISKADKKKSTKEKTDKKAKKSKKSKHVPEDNSASSEDATAGADAQSGANEDDATAANGAEVEEEAVQPGKKGRFIVFVGNLPYSATKESISEHFAKIHPTDIRLRTYKGTEKFMGTCFLEFDRFDRMETCLKKYHHSVFPDGKKKEGRKINIELSAGGGGNSESRKSKITAKNDKLHDERANDREKRAEIEMKQSERRAKKAAKGKKGGDDEAEEEQPDNAGMHPARLAMMQAPIQRPVHRQRY